MRPGDQLGRADAAWLHMETATNPMVVNGVLELGSRLSPERAAALVDRLASIPRFRSRVREARWHVGRPSWEVSPSFDIAEHIEHVELASGDQAALRTFLGSAVSGLLDRRRPLWRAYFIDRPGAGTTILFRAHHAIADGFALLGVLLSLCDDAPGAAIPRTAPLPRGLRSRAVLGSGRALARLVTLPADRRTLLKAPLGIEKRVAWSDPLPLADVKATAHRAGATVNDVLVAIAAGAVGRYLARRGEKTSGVELHAMVPVNLRPSMPDIATTPLGNRFGLVILGLPIGEADPFDRVAAVKKRMEALKGTPEALVTYALLGAMGVAPQPIEDLGIAFFGTKASLVLTNVPGPRARLTIAGAPVSRIVFWVPQSGRMGLGISISSYAGEVTIGIMSDAGLIPDPDALVSDLGAEYAALRCVVRDSPGS